LILEKDEDQHENAFEKQIENSMYSIDFSAAQEETDDVKVSNANGQL